MPVAVGGSEIGSVIYAFIKTVDDANVGFSYQPLLAHSQRVLSAGPSASNCITVTAEQGLEL